VIFIVWSQRLGLVSLVVSLQYLWCLAGHLYRPGFEQRTVGWIYGLDFLQIYSEINFGVPRRQPHRRSGLVDPALCGSRPLVTPYYCRLGTCCVLYVYHFVVLLYFVLFAFLGFPYFCSVFPSVLWYCWLGLLTCKTISQITYTVLTKTLNDAQLINWD